MPFTHQAVKDGRGRDLRLELRAEAMPLVRAATRLLLSGMGWLAMTKQLQDEGYRNPVTGGNFGHYQIRAIFYSPYSWGFAGTGYWGKSGEWAFDPTVASPPGVNIVYNPSVPIPALWEGEEAFQVQAELRRRGTLMRGRAMPHTKHALTGLMVCGVCGRRMVICYSGARTKAYGDIIYWACRNTKARHLGYRCANDKYAPDRELKKQISAFLSRIRDEGLLSLDELFAAPSEKSDLARINAERDDVTRQIQTLIYRQSKAAENLQIMYAEELSNLSKRLEALDLESLSAVQREQGQVIQRKTFDRLSSDLDNIWSQNAGEVNRLLLAFMGKFRFVVLEREIVDIKAI